MKPRIKIPLIITVLYLLIILLATYQFFQCNGVQFADYHGKCRLTLIGIPSLTQYISSAIWSHNIDVWMQWPVWLKHLETFLPFLIDLIIYNLAGFRLGLFMEKINKSKHSCLKHKSIHEKPISKRSRHHQRKIQTHHNFTK